MEVSSRKESIREITIKEDPIVMYKKEINDFIDSIIYDKPTFASALDDLKAIEAATAAEKSSKEGKKVTLPLVEY